MSKIINRFVVIVALLLILISLVPPIAVSAIGILDVDKDVQSQASELRYYIGSAVNTGKNNGYSKENKIEENDPQFGWTLGRFFLSGFTRVTEDANKKPVFLKTVGDTVTLWFHLDQDINKLNGNDELTISVDNNGYDEYFGIEKTDFGHGTLIIRHTDYQNLSNDPVIYTDYLVANATIGADTKVELFEEGDYEVALNYEIKKSPVSIFGQSILPSYENYRIFFRFSVRNGNCMVYPFDVSTKAELTNSSMTENGFYLDLAKSRYLDINIKKEVLKDGANGLIEDVRFNRPAKDGDSYTEEGIYTIVVSNRYTGQQTTKVIYVGTNNVLKAFVATGLSIGEIEEQLALGAKILEDGTIIPPLVQDPAVPDSIQPSNNSQPDALMNDSESEFTDTKSGVNFIVLLQDRFIQSIVIGIFLVVLFVSLIYTFRQSRRVKENVSSDEDAENADSRLEDNYK